LVKRKREMVGKGSDLGYFLRPACLGARVLFSLKD
jgi:hypothetical protein